MKKRQILFEALILYHRCGVHGKVVLFLYLILRSIGFKVSIDNMHSLIPKGGKKHTVSYIVFIKESELRYLGHY